MSFVGDGSAPGDGGLLLQKMWEKWPWRPVPNCSGTWSIKRVGDGVPPEALCQTCGISSVTPEKVKDGLVVIEFSDGGGLVSVCKTDGTFSHTLLTRSSLERKRETL
jgi:hypothetical protein